MEIHLAVVDDVRCHTSKGYAQVVGEVKRVGVAGAELLEQFCQVLALDETTCLQIALSDSQTCSEEIGILLSLVAETLMA